MIERVSRYKYRPLCDGCGEELPETYDFLDAVGAMRREGWTVIRPTDEVPEWQHFCPACAEELLHHD